MPAKTQWIYFPMQGWWDWVSEVPSSIWIFVMFQGYISHLSEESLSTKSTNKFCNHIPVLDFSRWPRIALVVMLRGDWLEGWLAHFGLKCSSWTSVNAGTSSRSPCCAIGNTAYLSVRDGNCLGSRILANKLVSIIYGFTIEIMISEMGLVTFPSFWKNHFIHFHLGMMHIDSRIGIYLSCVFDCQGQYSWWW